MGRWVFIPRLQQLTRFTDILQVGGAMHSRRSLFQCVTGLSEEETETLLYNGLCSLEAPVDIWEKTLADTKALGIESRVRDTLENLQSHYPCSGDLAVELYPMDAQDQFGRQKLGGISGWTNWAGTTIHLVIYPAVQDAPLQSTIVHEYHHYLRIHALNNGHNQVPLLEHLIREGLAEHFVAEVLGESARGPYAQALNASEALMLWQQVFRDRVFLTDDDTINPYVFGKGTSGLPLWAGYSMGYHLVDWYRNSHPDLSVSSLTSLNGQCFLPCA